MLAHPHPFEDCLARQVLAARAQAQRHRIESTPTLLDRLEARVLARHLGQGLARAEPLDSLAPGRCLGRFQRRCVAEAIGQRAVLADDGHAPQRQAEPIQRRQSELEDAAAAQHWPQSILIQAQRASVASARAFAVSVASHRLSSRQVLAPSLALSRGIGPKNGAPAI